MSFSSEASGSAAAPEFKSFVTESELDEKRKIRQAEWEKVRKPDDPIEAPEEKVDTRCLFDRLQEQKQKKDDEYEETHRLRNQVKGLEDDEASFLDFVSKRKTELDQAREDENESVLREYREAVVTRTSQSDTGAKAEKKNPKPQVVKNMKSQQAMLAGVVKRKSSSDADSSNKKQKPDPIDSGRIDKNEVSETIIERDLKLPRIIAVLPGLGAYSNSSDSDSSSSDVESGPDHHHRGKAGCKQHSSGH